MLRFLCCCLLYLFIYFWILAQWREWWDSAPVLDFYLLVVSWAHLQTHLSQCCCKPRATRQIGCWLKSPKIVLYKEYLFFVNWFIFSICYNGGELTSIASLSDKEDLKKIKEISEETRAVPLTSGSCQLFSGPRQSAGDTHGSRRLGKHQGNYVICALFAVCHSSSSLAIICFHLKSTQNCFAREQTKIPPCSHFPLSAIVNVWSPLHISLPILKTLFG